MSQRALSTTAFLTLLAIASLMAANHVAARVAFNLFPLFVGCGPGCYTTNDRLASCSWPCC